eukprot:16434327-Heterocapsa_arctica.AAC.1
MKEAARRHGEYQRVPDHGQILLVLLKTSKRGRLGASAPAAWRLSAWARPRLVCRGPGGPSAGLHPEGVR